MKKNLASQSIGVQMITASDGTNFTGTVTVVITIDNGTQSASGGTAPAHEGNGYHSYSPTQAETNGDHVAFTFTGTGAITSTVQVYTEFPQTGDNYARIGANGAGLSDLVTATGFATPTNITAATGIVLSGVTHTGAVIPNVTLVATTTALTGKTGFSLSAAGIDAVWDEPTSGHTTAGTFGVSAKDVLVDTADLQANQGDWATATGFSTAAAMATAQADLDIITGADGVTLATTQGNYAPNKTTPPTAAAIVNEWEAQSQADPGGFQVNIKEVNDVTVTGTGASGSEWGP